MGTIGTSRNPESLSVLNEQYLPDETTILVVDDEDSICHILKIGLEDKGYNVVTAHNAKMALEIAGTTELHMAIIDIKLPDMNGIELSERISRDNPRIISILMTGFPGIKSVIEALRHNIYDYLIKPFRIDQVVSSIERSRERYRIMAENYYSAELIRNLKRENEELKAELNELMPDKTRLQRKSMDKYRRLLSDQDVAVHSYTRHQKNKQIEKDDKPKLE